MGEMKGGEDSYDLEFKAAEDDAWYSVSVALNTVAQTLTVKYSCSPEVYQVTFSAGGFKTELEVEELARRFRPVSRQVQDNQCRHLEVGTTVCASHGTTQHDLRFYDAVIEAVNHRTHSFAGEEEECLCKFVLFWLHGRGRGTLTSSNIANICTLEPLSEIDPRISAFLILAKEKVHSSKSLSGLRSFGPGSKGSSSDKSNSSMSIEKNLEPSRNRLMGTETSMTSKSLMRQNSWNINNYEQWTSQDEDIGPQDGLALAKHRHFILIHNLEKDIIPSSIKKFIYKKTNILPQAFVFPRQSLDPFARGAIVVDSEKKAQIIYEFLDNPNYIIESSRGRPWVITEKAFTRTLETASWNLLPVDLDEIQCVEAGEELKIVHSGSKSYEKAKALRDLVVEYVLHESRMFNKLVVEEKKIWSSFELGIDF